MSGFWGRVLRVDWRRVGWEAVEGAQRRRIRGELEEEEGAVGVEVGAGEKEKSSERSIDGDILFVVYTGVGVRGGGGCRCEW